MTAIFRITDGTTIVDLIKPQGGYGFHLVSWRPSIPSYKGGGAFQESSLSWGRRLIDKQFENYISTLSLTANQTSQDILIQELQEIRRLLEKASSYWTSRWGNEPVWIEAKATKETNTRYAIIVLGRIAEDDNPYSQPFLQPDCSAVMNGLTLVIEHETWTENAPGTSTAVEISAAETYDGRTLGNVDDAQVRDPTTASEVYVKNSRQTANLTDIYIDDGGVFSANLLDAALPYALLPAAMVVNDAIYFGIDTTVADSRPFGNLIFDISVGGTGYNGAWEFWNGAWVGLGVTDNTAVGGIELAATGVNEVIWPVWLVATAWVPTAINGVTAYWVRMRVTATPGGAKQQPIQQNRNVYAVAWPYTEIDDLAVPGDVPSLSRFKIEPFQGSADGQEIYAGLRSLSRGDAFNAYINIADEQNPAGVVCAVGTAANVSFANNVGAPSGRIFLWNPAAALDDVQLAVITFSAAMSSEYIGKYRAFCRVDQSGGAVGDFSLRAVTNFGGEILGPRRSVNTLDLFGVVDLGVISLGVGTSDLYSAATISLLGTNTGGAPGDLYIYDLILIPTDEWSINVKDTSFAKPFAAGRYLDVDAITSPKKVRASLKVVATDEIVYDYLSVTSGKPMFQSNAEQRLWFFFVDGDDADDRTAEPSLYRVLCYRNARYLSQRGLR